MNFLSQEQAKRYEEDGLLTGIPVLDSGRANRFRTHFDALERKEGRERCAIGLFDRHFDLKFIWEIATDPVILDVIEDVIGPNFHLLATHFFCKYGPESKKFVAWHQDVTFWGLEPPEAATAWYAVDDSDVGNGCMRAIPGSHKSGIRTHGKSQQAGNLLSINQEISITPREESSAVDMPLMAGEISLHDGALIHGSLPNRSQRRRCGLTLRYVRTSTSYPKLNSYGRRFRALLVRGVDREKHFGNLPAPFAN